VILNFGGALRGILIFRILEHPFNLVESFRRTQSSTSAFAIL
jgi:hypothetical protein